MRERLSYKDIVRQTDLKLKSIIGTELPIFKKIRNFVTKSGGKRIRPLIHYYTARMLGYSGDECCDVGAIGELIHAASLLHDDVVDEAQRRRYRPSVNSLYGNKRAVLSGDYLLSCGLDHLTTLKSSLPLLTIFTRAVRMLAIGEILQMHWEKRFNISEEIYNKIIMGKTAALFGCMTESASILANGGDQKREREKYRAFGERLGYLFQIRDDYLDYYAKGNSGANSRGANGRNGSKGNSKRLFSDILSGKERYQDFRCGLVTRPVILLRRYLKKRERKIVENLFSADRLKVGPQEIETIMSMFDRYRIDTKMAREIEEEAHALMRFLRKSKASLYRDSLIEQMTHLLVSA